MLFVALYLSAQAEPLPWRRLHSAPGRLQLKVPLTMLPVPSAARAQRTSMVAVAASSTP